MNKKDIAHDLLYGFFGGLISLLILSRFKVTPLKFTNPVSGFNQPLKYSETLKQTRIKSAKIWLPRPERILESSAFKPVIKAQAALAFDLTSETFLYQKEIKAKRPIASLVKIMTAIVALKRTNLDRVFTVDSFSAEVGEDSMGLSEGEKYTLEELLYGMFLVSGNDAAETIAKNIAGDRETFIDLMNEKAAEIGLFDTHFVNPTGLTEDSQQDYSTVYDVLLMTRYAITTYPVLKEIAATKYYEIPYSGEHKYLYLESVTNLLGQYPGVSGFKTGYTPNAGLCLVTLAENGSHEIVLVILDSSDRRGDAILLLDHAFGLFNIPVEHNLL